MTLLIALAGLAAIRQLHIYTVTLPMRTPVDWHWIAGALADPCRLRGGLRRTNSDCAAIGRNYMAQPTPACKELQP